jgi:O-antigen/teichoic acid export membrane protein
MKISPDKLAIEKNGIPSPTQAEIVGKAALSVKWTLLSSLAPRLITPLATMLLAGLLTPDDFGIVATATLVVTLAQIVVGLGMGTAVIQRQTDIEEAASAAFGLSMVVATFLYGGLWWMSPMIAAFYQNPVLVDVIRVAGLTLFLSALTSIPTALLQRQLDFRRLFWIGAAPQIVTAISSVVFAWIFESYWALVIGQLAGLAINVALVWHASAWRPQRIFNPVLARSLFIFGLWIMASSFQSWLFLYGDNAIIAYYLGVRQLGEYSLGFNMANLLPGMLVVPLAVIAYPAFCAIQDKGPREVGLNMLKLQRVIAAILFPVCFGISAIAIPAVSLVYGDKWPQLGMVIHWLILMPGLSHIWSLNADAYRAIGQPQVWTKVALINLLVLMPLLMVIVPLGTKPFVIARFLGAALYPMLNIIIGGRVLNLSVKEQLQPFYSTLIPSVVMYLLIGFLVAALAPFQGPSGWLKLTTIILIGASIYLGGIKWRDPDLWQSVLSSIFRTFAGA